MYKLNPDTQTPSGLVSANTILLVEENKNIPFDPANTDYQKFKADVLAGAELQDADGNVMTAEQANEFISTLP